MILTPPKNLRTTILKDGFPCNHDLMATPNFSWQELLTKQKETPNIDILENLLKVAQILEMYRVKLFHNASIIITSGWRSHNYNQSIGGAPNSFHTLGLAADFTVNGFSIPQLYDLMDKIHFGGVERTNGDWQHIDLRGKILRFNTNNTVLASHYDVAAHDIVV